MDGQGDVVFFGRFVNRPEELVAVGAAGGGTRGQQHGLEAGALRGTALQLSHRRRGILNSHQADAVKPLVLIDVAILQPVVVGRRRGGGEADVAHQAESQSRRGKQHTALGFQAIEDFAPNLLDAGLEDVAFFAICDPQAVNDLMAAGIGAELELALGGKTDLDAIAHKGTPLDVSGRVKLISDGRFVNRGPMSAGLQMDMGPTVVFDTGKVEIIVDGWEEKKIVNTLGDGEIIGACGVGGGTSEEDEDCARAGIARI